MTRWILVLVTSLLLTVTTHAPRIRQNAAMKREVAELRQEIEGLRDREPYVLVVEEPCEHVTKEKTGVEVSPEAIDEVDLLARLIMCEMGSDGHPDEQLYNVGSVVLNRVKDPRFPNTVRDVIYAPGQYAPAISGAISTVKPTQRCYDIAGDLLVNGSRLPADVVWQSNAPQGTDIYEMYYSPVIGTTTYYCR